MAQTPLVEQIDEGRRLIERLVEMGIGVIAACWLNEEESGQWYLYIATPLVPENGSKKAAYRQINATIRDMQQEGFWFDVLGYKVVSPSSPIAKVVQSLHDRYPGRKGMAYTDLQFGGVPIDGAYVYPPIAAGVS